MIGRHPLAALALALAAAPAGAHTAEGASPHETVAPLFSHALPTVAGKRMLVVEVTFPPGGAAPAHTHPASAFLYAYVLSGEVESALDDGAPRVYHPGESWYEDPGARHTLTRNASADVPARLLVVFLLDEGETELVRPIADAARP